MASIDTRVPEVAVALNPGPVSFHVGDSFSSPNTVGGVTASEKSVALLDAENDFISAANLAVNGNMAWDQHVTLFERIVTAGEQNTVLFEFNDDQVYGSDLTKRHEFARAYVAVAWWLATLDTEKKFAGAVTFNDTSAGHWAADTSIYATTGSRQVYATPANGDTVTFTFKGRTGYFLTVARDDNDATYTFSVDDWHDHRPRQDLRPPPAPLCRARGWPTHRRRYQDRWRRQPLLLCGWWVAIQPSRRCPGSRLRASRG